LAKALLQDCGKRYIATADAADDYLLIIVAFCCSIGSLYILCVNIDCNADGLYFVLTSE